MLTPIGEILFDHLDLAVLYDPDKKTAIVHYVYCRTIERIPFGLAHSHFFRVTRNLEEHIRLEQILHVKPALGVLYNKASFAPAFEFSLLIRKQNSYENHFRSLAECSSQCLTFHQTDIAFFSAVAPTFSFLKS